MFGNIQNLKEKSYIIQLHTAGSSHLTGKIMLTAQSEGIEKGETVPLSELLTAI